MAKLLFISMIAVCLLTGTVPLYAAQSGDMFSDEGFAAGNRPSVPSDQYYGYRNHPDMFPPQAPYVHTDKDMFDSVPKPSNPGIERDFSAHTTNMAVPDGPLFDDPNGSR